MAPTAPLTPASSGTTTPTTASALTSAGIKHQTAAPTPAQLDASKTTFTFTTSPRPVPASDSAETRSQKVCTDHMITARWTAEQGWEAPSLRPYGPLSLMPTASVLHYATECFEGLKLYRGATDGKLRLFRVNRNCERMRRSASRIALPDFPASELEAMITTLCSVDGPRWLPDSELGRGRFLYVRPTFIATEEALGVQRPREALLYVIIACFPDMTKNMAMYPTANPAPPALEGASAQTVQQQRQQKPGGGGLRLLASDEDTIRAWPGGFGYAKLGANYGPTLVAQGEARARGFDQVLWLFGPEGRVTEAGASNFFAVLKNKETGRTELVTAPLDERIILEGVTRASILDLARERLGDEQVDVVERTFTMDELVAAQKEGRLVEAFAAGTAFFVAPICLIHFRGNDVEVPMAEGDSGKFARMIKGWLMGIMYGPEVHEWAKVVPEKKDGAAVVV